MKTAYSRLLAVLMYIVGLFVLLSFMGTIIITVEQAVLAGIKLDRNLILYNYAHMAYVSAFVACFIAIIRYAKSMETFRRDYLSRRAR